MARQIIDNGSFDNDPGAEKIRLAFGKVNDMTAELYSFLSGTGKAIERIVQHVESGESELVEVANSVNAAAPITKPRYTLLIVSFLDPYSQNSEGINYVKKRQYILNRPEGNYGNTGTAVLPTDFIILTPNIIGINETTTFNLGNIMGAEIDEYVNTSGPYLVIGTTIFETTEGSYVFSGADGLYGLGEIQTIPQNFIPFGNAPNTNAWEKIHNLSLVGIETEGVDELTYIANAVIQYGPFTCEPDQQIILRTTTPYDEGVIDRYYAVIPRVTSIGGILGAVVYPSYFRPDGQSIIDTIPSDIIIELGDIGTDDVEDAFNEGDGGDPWDMSVKRFIRATYDGDVTLWSWQGEDGEFGGSGTPATADDFFLITGEPSIPISSQNNIIKTIPVLDTDLATLDAAGLATYFNELEPGVMKQGYESWLIQIVDSGGGVLKTFDFVNRGKGPVGVEGIAENPANAVTAVMFVERADIPSTPTLQQVTTAGNTTSLTITAAEYHFPGAHTLVGKEVGFTGGSKSGTLVGYRAGGITTGTNNIALGTRAIYASAGSHDNIVIGDDSVLGNGFTPRYDNSIFIGSDIKIMNQTRDNIIAIGNALELSANNRVTLGNSTHTSTVLNGGNVSAPNSAVAGIDIIGDKAITTKEYVDRKQIKTISDDTYTLLETDNNKILNFTSATDVTITVPTGLTVGNRFEGKQRGDGQLIFISDGTTVINTGSTETNKTLERYSVWGLDCCDTDEYDLFGKLELV